MRFNPFARRVSRRRAAMTGGDVSEDVSPAIETEDWSDEPPLPNGDGIEQDDDGKQFGFAYRQESDALGDAVEPAAAALCAPTESLPSAAEPALEAPAVGTPHIDRLRAEIGADAADVIERRLPEEAGATASADLSEPHPKFRPRFWQTDANEAAAEQAVTHQLRATVEQGETLESAAGSEPPPPLPIPIPASVPPFLTASEPAIDQHEPDEPVGSRQDEVNQKEVEPEETDPIEDVAVTIGRVVSIRGSVIWGALFDDIDGQAARAARMGALVSMRGPESRVFGIVNRLEREQQMGSAQSERTLFEVQVLGEIADDRTGFQRGVSSYPPLDAPVTTITIRDIAMIYARPRSSNVHIGQLRHNPKVPAFVLTDSLLGKHFAVLGTTGTGKSCATTVILRSILDDHPKGHVVLIDPHNEYGPAFADRAELLNPGNLQLPYWLLNFEEIAHVVLYGASREQLHSQGTLLKNAIILAKTQFAGGDQESSQITADTPVPYRLSDLVSILKEGMGTFNKAEGATLYLSLINRIESLHADKRFAFMFSSISVRDNMEQVLAQLLRIPTAGKPMTIIDISGLPSESMSSSRSCFA